MKDHDPQRPNPPENINEAEQEATPIETDATTGSEGGGPGVGFGPEPDAVKEQSSASDRPTSSVGRNQAPGSKRKSRNSGENSLKFIPTSIHGVMDYALGALLIAAPWLLGFNRGGAETWVPVILGAAIIFYSLITAYELGLIGAISMPAHLGLDFIGGLVLAASPWLFGFADIVWIPHLAIGLVEIATALSTRATPSYVPLFGSGGRSPSRS